MDIHKPKIAHSWREFITEIATIVLGILIGLSLEQAVASLREARVASEARNAVKAEIAEDLSVFNWRKKEQACIDRRLAEIGEILDHAVGAEAFPQVRSLGRPTTVPIFTLRLQAASQAGHASLLENDEQETYGEIYFGLQSYLELQAQEQASWAHLNGLVGFKSLSPEMVLSLRQALGEANYENSRINLIIQRTSQTAAKAKIAPARLENLARMRTCAPMSESPASA